MEVNNNNNNNDNNNVKYSYTQDFQLKSGFLFLVVTVCQFIAD